jgi:hypothetical protein
MTIKQAACKAGRLILGGALLGATVCYADTPKYDFYSWVNPKVEKEWCYSIFPASDKPVSTAEIKSTHDQVCGRHNAKRLLGQTVAEGGKVYWKTNTAEGLVLPTRDIANELIRFADNMDFKLIPPEGSGMKKDGWR